ncbi:hypothetical protein HDV00_004656 [Rhizophlyctis rosea]|nr:hypothetical protein HDV00_004656 [Rhizophlyctis rosea]
MTQEVGETTKSTTIPDGNMSNFCYTLCEFLHKRKKVDGADVEQDHINEFNDFDVYVAPASGPTGFVTMGFEKRFRTLAKDGRITGEKWFVGSSTGALRWTALLSDIVERDRRGPKRVVSTSLSNPYSNQDRSDQLAEQYMDMTYKDGDTPDSLGVMMEKMYNIVLPQPDDLSHLLSHPRFHLAIMVVAIHPRYATLHPILLKLVFLFHFLLYVLVPPSIALIFKRYCFYTGPTPPSHILNPISKSQPLLYEPLTVDNIRSVLHATTGIPFIQPPCISVPGLPPGLYIDGGFTDLLLNFRPSLPTLVLADNGGATRGSIKPTFFDVALPWRKTPKSALKMCGIVAPVTAFRMQLPDKRYPNVMDWFRKEYKLDAEKRRRNWKRCYEISVGTFPEVLVGGVKGKGREGVEGDGTVTSGGLVDLKEE